MPPVFLPRSPSTLMVHRGDHRCDAFAVRECQHGDLRTRQEFLNDELRAALAEDFILHNGANCVDCLLLGLRNDNALAECKTVCLDDRRISILLFDIADCGFGIGKDLIFCGRDAVFLHEILREHLAALNDRGSLGGTEDLEAVFTHQIRHAEHQRIIRRNENPINSELFGKRKHAVQISCLHRKTLGIFCNAAVARCTVESGDQRGFAELHNNGVLSAAAADY